MDVKQKHKMQKMSILREMSTLLEVEVILPASCRSRQNDFSICRISVRN